MNPQLNQVQNISWVIWFLIASIILLAIGIILHLPRKTAATPIPKASRKKLGVVIGLVIASIAALLLYFYGIPHLGTDVASTWLPPLWVGIVGLVLVLMMIMFIRTKSIRNVGSGIKTVGNCISALVSGLAKLLVFFIVLAFFLWAGHLVIAGINRINHDIARYGHLELDVPPPSKVISAPETPKYEGLELLTRETKGREVQFVVANNGKWSVDDDNYAFDLGFMEGDGTLYRVEFSMDTTTRHEDAKLGDVPIAEWNRTKNGRTIAEGIMTFKKPAGPNSRVWVGEQFVKNGDKWQKIADYKICPIRPSGSEKP